VQPDTHVNVSRDVLEIIGAGPSGLAAAIVAARAGRRVVVYERQHTVGARFKGDFQGLENWTATTDVLDEFRALGIEPTFEANPVFEQTCYGPDAREYRFESKRPFYYLVRRGDVDGTLDRALLAQALALGVEIRFGETVRPPPPSAVNAQGPRTTNILVTGILFETDLSDRSIAVLGGACAPGGYAYLLVNRGRATMACCIFGDFRRAKTYFARTEQFFRDRVTFTATDVRPFGGFGAAFLTPRSELESTRVGEASGVQDALWGFGIRTAVRSGALAARRDAMTADAYAREWNELLGTHVKTGIVNRFLLDRSREIAYRWLLRQLRRSDEPWRVLHDVYAPAAWKRALFPIADHVRRRATGSG
jgi:flavin-dependent dehydrogenase